MGAMSSIGLVSTRMNPPSCLMLTFAISIFSWSPHVLQDVWAAMLEETHWLADFMLQKTNLMADHYSITTSFLSDNSIPFYET